MWPFDCKNTEVQYLLDICKDYNTIVLFFQYIWYVNSMLCTINFYNVYEYQLKRDYIVK